MPANPKPPTNDMWIWPVVVLISGNSLLFMFCQSPWGKRDNSWIDVMWSLSFVTPNIFLLIYRGVLSDYGICARQIFANILVFIWALRLSFHIFIRHTSEDYRYKEMRQNWEKKG